MGCNTSEVSGTTFNTRSPAVDSLSQQDKNKIRKAIKIDNLLDFATTISELQTPLHAEISQSGLKWMMTHLCCRYNSPIILEFLLKNFYVENSSKYIDFVNAPTVQGYTALHLCAIWKNEKCFNVLYYYGGLHLNATDKNKKTPGQLAIQNKCKNMTNLLIQNKDLNVSFTIVQTDKLIAGDLISSTPEENQATIERNLKVQKQNIPKQSSQIIKLKNDKTQLQKQIDNIIQMKMDKQNQIQKQKVELTKNTNLNKKKPDGLKQKQQINKNIDQSLKAEREKFKAQITSKQEQINKIQEQIKQLQEAKVNGQKALAKLKAENHSKQQQQVIKNIIKLKNQHIENIKTKKNESKENQDVIVAVAQKPEKAIQPVINVRSALTQSFQGLQQKLPIEIERLYEEAKGQGLFIDKEFPATNESIGDKSNPNFANFKSTIVWLRPSQIFQEDTQYELFSGGIDPNDIQQGQLGVCYLLAAISSLSSYPAQIQKMFVFTDIQIGFYVIKLFINGKPKYFVVDDLIPCDKNTNYPVFTQPVGNQLWVMLIQKCWAKAIGSYLSAQGMVPDQMMQDLTSAPGFGSFFDEDTQKGITIAQAIQTLVDNSNSGNTIVLTTKQKPCKGLVENHAYTLLKCYKVNNKNVFKVRNPWANFQWQGEYSQKSKNFTPQIKNQVQYTNTDDGIFFLSQKQLLKGFSYYSVNINFDSHVYSYVEFSSKKQQDKYFKFTLTQASTTNVRITQLFGRMLKDINYAYSGVIIEIGKIQDKKVRFISQGDNNTIFGAKSVHGFQNVTQQLEAGEYFVRIRMLWKNQNKYNKAVLSVFASKAVKIQQINPKIGLQYLKQLFISHAENMDRNEVDDQGTGYFKIDTMKGQFVFIAYTDNNKSYDVEFQLLQEQIDGVRLQLGKITNLKVKVPVKKNSPGVGTAIIISPADGGTTGEVYATFNPK